MFNKSASIDFIKRLSDQLGQQRASLVKVQTFHSLGYRLLRYFHRTLNIPYTASILSDGLQQTIVAQALKIASASNQQKLKLMHKQYHNICIILA